MKIVIWLGCILVFSLAQLILATQGIMLGGIPTALLAAVLVFIPAPALCKKWQERHGQTGETKSAETPPVPPDAPPAASNPGRRQKVHAYVRTAAPPSPTADAPRAPEDSTPSPSAETPQHTEKPRQGGKIPIAAAKLPVLLACGCLILAAATTVFGILYFSASAQIDSQKSLLEEQAAQIAEQKSSLEEQAAQITSQESSLEEKEDEISWLNTKCSMKEKKLDELTKSNTDLQSEVCRLSPYESVVQNQLGIIVDNSNTYHNYDCSKVQKAESYVVIMDVVECAKRGLKYCPNCWTGGGPFYLSRYKYIQKKTLPSQ